MFLKVTVFALLTASSLFQNSIARAEWPAESLEWARHFADEKIKFEDPDLITIWGGFQSTHSAIYNSIRKNIVAVHLKSKEFKTGELLAKFYAQRDKSGKIISAPLIVFMPGIFDGFTSNLGMRSFYQFSLRGYHVLGIPNPWSVTYVSENPLSSPSDIGVEAKVIIELIRNFKNFLGPQNIKSVGLTGESYGGLLATAAFSTDANSKQHEIDGPVTVFSPPIDLELASRVLDSLLAQTPGFLSGPCAIATNGAGFIYDLAKRDTETAMRNPTKSCARSLLARSFMNNLIRTSETYESVHGLKNIPNKFYEPLAYESWSKTLRFGTFMKRYLPSDYRNNVELGQLAYWVSTTPENAKHQLRFMSAEDDLLNKSEDWTSITQITPQNSLILLPWGGHIGFESLPEFNGLLDVSFGKPVLNQTNMNLLSHGL